MSDAGSGKCSSCHDEAKAEAREVAWCRLCAGRHGATRRRVGLRVCLLLHRPVVWRAAAQLCLHRALRVAGAAGSSERVLRLTRSLPPADRAPYLQCALVAAAGRGHEPCVSRVCEVGGVDPAAGGNAALLAAVAMSDRPDAQQLVVRRLLACPEVMAALLSGPRPILVRAARGQPGAAVAVLEGLRRAGHPAARLASDARTAVVTAAGARSPAQPPRPRWGVHTVRGLVEFLHGLPGCEHVGAWAAERAIRANNLDVLAYLLALDPSYGVDLGECSLAVGGTGNMAALRLLAAHTPPPGIFAPATVRRNHDALRAMARGGHEEMIRYVLALASSEADAWARGLTGSPLLSASAAHGGSVPILQLVCEELPEPLRAPLPKASMLRRASSRGHVAVLRWLLEPRRATLIGITPAKVGRAVPEARDAAVMAVLAQHCTQHRIRLELMKQVTRPEPGSRVTQPVLGIIQELATTLAQTVRCVKGGEEATRTVGFLMTCVRYAARHNIPDVLRALLLAMKGVPQASSGSPTLWQAAFLAAAVGGHTDCLAALCELPAAASSELLLWLGGVAAEHGHDDTAAAARAAAEAWSRGTPWHRRCNRSQRGSGRVVLSTADVAKATQAAAAEAHSASRSELDRLSELCRLVREAGFWVDMARA